MLGRSILVSSVIVIALLSLVADGVKAREAVHPASLEISSIGASGLSDACACVCLATGGAGTGGFAGPPSSARPAVYWVWVNGLTNKQQLTYELEEMRAKGISGVYIFDVGAQDPEGIVPAGPAFMGPESLEAIGHAVREATRLGLDVGIVTSSSWNCGGPWVRPEHASMGLFHCQVTVNGPAQFSETLPFPTLPKKVPRGPDGSPAYYKDVAVLAVPQPKRLRGHEFLFELAGPSKYTVDRVVLYNTSSGDEKRYGKMHLFTKDFAVLVSATTADLDAFEEVVRGALKPHIEAQTYRFEPIEAKYVKLVIFTGHNHKSDRIQLGEFEVYSTQGNNAVAAYHVDGSRTRAKLMHYSSQLGLEDEWTAANIHDGKKSGADGSWSSDGPPPLIIEDTNDIIDLTSRVDKNGRLIWSVPPGEWTILRFVCANTGLPLRLPSPNSHGLAIDHFNSQATKTHFDYFIDRLHQEIGSFKDTALKQMYVCSYELSGSTWTPDFLEEFKKRRDYDMTNFLPVLSGCIVENHEITERFRYDYRKTLGDLLVDAFYRTARQASNQHGLLLCAEAGGPGPPLHQVPVDALKALGALDIPRGEFWKDHNVWVVKETACASHIYGKRIIDMEAFTSWRHWLDGPFDIKGIADRALCGGTNHFTFHTSAHNPPGAGLPGWVYHAGTHISPSLVWWPKAKPFIDYLSRCCYLLQQGLFVADVCYYYGDQGFNFVPPKHVDPSLGPGYDYDVTNAEVILTYMDVKNGKLILPDRMSYELLVLPDREDIDWAVLEKIERLVKAGATVVGRKPTRSNGLTDYPHRDIRVRNLANKLWGPCDGKECTQHSYEKGKVIWGKTLREILRSRGVGPDFSFASRNGEKTKLDYIHRRVKGDDIYFVSNQNEWLEEVDCVFRVFGKAPEIWSPDTGDIRRQAVYDFVKAGTRVPLCLPPAGSVFVVFRKATDEDHVVSLDIDDGSRLAGSQTQLFPAAGRAAQQLASIEILPGEQNELELQVWKNGTYTLKTAQGKEMTVKVNTVPAMRKIKGPWEIRFPQGWGAPVSKVFPELISWTEDAEEGIRYFSGIAAYHKEIDIPAEYLAADRRIFLDLGRVRFVAEVYLNGKSLGVLWKPPFQVDITGAAGLGENQLVIEVANTWANRLIGDARSPQSKKYCQTNITKSLTWSVPWKDTPLLESGLLGPVRLIAAAKLSLRLPK